MAFPVSEVKVLCGKKQRRFYEAIIMLKALSNSIEDSPTSESESTSTSVVQADPRHTFETFVYRLAYGCSFLKGGDAIASISILVENGSPLFVFGCNNVSEEQGRSIARHLKSLLANVARASKSRSRLGDLQRGQILKQILVFNRDRIGAYLCSIASCARNCFERELDAHRRETASLSALKELANCVQPDLLESYAEEEYIRGCILCLKSIKAFVKARGFDVDISSGYVSEDWANLKHSASRMLAYDGVLESLFAAYERWPDLFKDPKFEHVQSIKADTRPISRKSETAEAIIGRMTSDPAAMDMYRQYAEELSKFEIDDRIKTECRRTPFLPVVHSEVLIQGWIDDESHRRQVQFFNGWNYIGSSKPPCRLCTWYFEAWADRFKLRPSHGNLYVQWWFPPAKGGKDSTAVRNWQPKLDFMFQKIREDAFSVIREKRSRGKRYDSNTYKLSGGLSTRQSNWLGGSKADEFLEIDDGFDADVAELGGLFRHQLLLRP